MLDKKDYVDKGEGLLAQLAYRTINTDPTNKLKAKLILTLKRVKRETNMGEGMYRTMYPTSCIAPKFYGLSKIHKTGTPFRPIVSIRGLVIYGVAKVIAKVLKPLIGKSPHHIQSASGFVSTLGGLSIKYKTKLSMATEREMVTTVLMLAVQHKASALPVVVVKSQPPPGQDPVWDT